MNMFDFIMIYFCINFIGTIIESFVEIKYLEIGFFEWFFGSYGANYFIAFQLLFYSIFKIYYFFIKKG
jgi:hypothetical protein